MRVFAGLGLPSAIASTLSKIEGGLPGARWISPDNYHITLTFIGEVPESKAVELNESLSKIVLPGFDIQIEGLGTFGHAKPHTLWAGVSVTPDLTRLQAKTTQAARDLGLDIEKRKFLPHVTLARLHDAPLDRLNAFISGNNPFHAGSFRLLTFTLFESTLTKDGANYSRLMDYPLI